MSERGFTEGDLDKALTGSEGTELGRFVVALRTGLVSGPAPETSRSHIASMMAAVTPAPAPVVEPRSMSRVRAFGMRLSAATAGVLAATTGLAYAGVDLPGTATASIVEAVLPVELPNQSDHSRSDEVHAVQSSATPQSGCEYGQAVSDAANGDHGSDKTHDPCAKDPEAQEPVVTPTEDPEEPKKPKKPKDPKGPDENPSEGNKGDAEENSNGHSGADEAPMAPKPRPTREPKENPSESNKAEAHDPQTPQPQNTKAPQPQNTKDPKPEKT